MNEQYCKKMLAELESEYRERCEPYVKQLVAIESMKIRPRIVYADQIDPKILEEIFKQKVQP